MPRPPFNTLLAICILLGWHPLIAQDFASQNLSPNGVFDTVLDRFGNRYPLSEIATAERPRTGRVKTVTCTSGYFNLYFAAGSGAEGDSPAETARRDVLCQVFTDLAKFIEPADPAVKVNIWIRDIERIVPPPFVKYVLGLASSFYVLPQLQPTASGIADNEIWKTINAGTDSYTNVVSPLATQEGSAYPFYHGYIALNFSSPLIEWHTILDQVTQDDRYDLYTIVLHEVVHALGFASLIDEKGNSKFGTDLPYYSRYDTFLETAEQVPLLSSPTACSPYDYTFNPLLAPAILAPDTLDCATHIRFAGSVGQAVYTPTAFAPPSSLSHLEENCHSPLPYPDNEYYVMSDANGTGPAYMKRYLREEERRVLCDIGYRVNSRYGSPERLNYVVYADPPCQLASVAGSNDGIDAQGFYRYAAKIGEPITIPFAELLQNDRNADSVACLQELSGLGTIDTIAGQSFTYTAHAAGLAILRYVPVASDGRRGNITYLLISARADKCVMNACDRVINGGVESGFSCGQLYATLNCDSPPLPVVDCGYELSGTPDYYHRGCDRQDCTAGLGANIPNSLSSPPADTWNHYETTNDRMLGLASVKYSPTSLNESIQLALSRPLLPKKKYLLRFVARVVNASSYFENLPGAIEVAGSEDVLAPISYFFNAVPAPLTSLAQAKIPNNNEWNSYEIPFVNPSGAPINFISVVNAQYLTDNPVNTRSYLFIDDVSIVPFDPAGVLNLPDTLAIGQSIPELSTYLTDAPPGGTFTGAGVGQDATGYYFDSALAGIGEHTVRYTFTTNNGCAVFASANITVVDQTVTTAEISDRTAVRVYPNPGNSRLSIATNGTGKHTLRVRLWNVQSELLLQRAYPGGRREVTLDLTRFASGVYYLQLIAGETVWMKQVVKY